MLSSAADACHLRDAGCEDHRGVGSPRKKTWTIKMRLRLERGAVCRGEDRDLENLLFALQPFLREKKKIKSGKKGGVEKSICVREMRGARCVREDRRKLLVRRRR